MPRHVVLFLLIIVSLQIPLKAGAGDPRVERNLRQDPPETEAATETDGEAAARQEQWRALTSFVTRGATDDIYALARQGLLDTGVNLVGDWRPRELIALPPFADAFRVVNSLEFVEHCLSLLLGNPSSEFIPELKRAANRRLLEGWRYRSVDRIVSLLVRQNFGDGVEPGRHRFRATQIFRQPRSEAYIDRLLSIAQRRGAEAEEACEALRRLSIYHTPLRALAIQALNKVPSYFNATDLELIHYWLFGVDSEAVVLAAIEAAEKIQHPDIVYVLTERLRLSDELMTGLVTQQKLIETLGNIGNLNREPAIDFLSAIAVEKRRQATRQLRQAAYISLGKLDAWREFPQDTTLFFAEDLEMWNFIASELNMSLGDLADVVRFDHTPHIQISGETIDTQNLLGAFQRQFETALPNLEGTTLDSILQRSLQEIHVSETAQQSLFPFMDAARTAYMELLTRGRLTSQSLRVPLMRFLAQQVR